MELLSAIPFVGGALSVAVPFLIVLTIVVFVHEFGHYMVGRWCGIRAEVFSVGFGKPLFGVTDRHGTRWQVAMLPLGGYVRFVGDMDPASAGRADDSDLTVEERRAAFHNASLIRRTLTVAAGPVANFLLSVLVFAFLALQAGEVSNEPVIASVSGNAQPELGLEAGDRVLQVDGEPVKTFGEVLGLLLNSNGKPLSVVVERGGDTREVSVVFHNAPEIASVTPGMPGARAGLMIGDLFVSVDGQPVKTYHDLQITTARTEPGAEVSFEVLRGGKLMEFRLTPAMVERLHPETGEKKLIPTIGITGSLFTAITPDLKPISAHRAALRGVDETWRIISGTLIYIYDMVFAGADTSQLGGPIRIAEVSGDAAEQGISSLVYLIAVLSTSIGLINLFPIPILDGGHLMFYGLEALRGRPVSEAWMQIGTRIGLGLVLLLMVFATYNDLLRL